MVRDASSQLLAVMLRLFLFFTSIELIADQSAIFPCDYALSTDRRQNENDDNLISDDCPNSLPVITLNVRNC